MLLAAVVWVGMACGDDTTVTSTSQIDESTSGTDTTPSTVTITTFDTEGSTAVVDSTETASASATDSTTEGDTTEGEDTTAGDDTTTGEEALPGQSVHQLVTAGGQAASRSYTLIYTLGQPSQLQSTHASANYRIQGGLIGANGSPP